MIAAMERKEILITDKLLDQLLPSQEEGEGEEEYSDMDSDFPVDKNIMKIAKKIMEKPKDDEPEKPSSTEKTKPKPKTGRGRKKS